jgi:hypothetical protein
MTNRIANLLAVAVLAAPCFIGVACSSGTGTNPLTGNDASTGGSGGTTGMSGSCSKGTMGVASTGDPCVEVKNKAACDQDMMPGTTDDKACWNTCGPNKSGVKNCACEGGMWNCPTCDFDISDPRKYDCYKTGNAVACPADPTDPTGNMLPASGGECTLPACTPCGSASVTSYRDSTGAPKAGWCICVDRPDGTGKVYSCASVNEWAPQCQ